MIQSKWILFLKSIPQISYIDRVLYYFSRSGEEGVSAVKLGVTGDMWVVKASGEVEGEELGA